MLGKGNVCLSWKGSLGCSCEYAVASAAWALAEIKQPLTVPEVHIAFKMNCNAFFLWDSSFKILLKHVASHLNKWWSYFHTLGNRDTSECSWWGRWGKGYGDFVLFFLTHLLREFHPTYDIILCKITRQERGKSFVNAFVDVLGQAEKSKFKLYLELHQTNLMSIWND